MEILEFIKPSRLVRQKRRDKRWGKELALQTLSPGGKVLKQAKKKGNKRRLQ